VGCRKPAEEEEGPVDSRTDMTNPKVALLNFATAPKKDLILLMGIEPRFLGLPVRSLVTMFTELLLLQMPA
jgi:hypothetical protein